MVRNVFTKLDALDETQDTLAVFISDNGFLWGEHSWTGKGYPYLESVKVPFYFRWPGQALLRPSTVDTRLVADIDLAPTVLKTLGIPTIADEPMDGLNLLGPKTRDFWLLENWRNDVTIGGYFNNPPASASILTPQYQYTEYYDDTGSLVKPIAAYPWRTSPLPGDPATAAGETQVREYYDLSGALGPPDPHQLKDPLGDNSTSNNPPPATLSWLDHKLDYERSCRGQGEVAGQDLATRRPRRLELPVERPASLEHGARSRRATPSVWPRCRRFSEHPRSAPVPCVAIDLPCSSIRTVRQPGIVMVELGASRCRRRMAPAGPEGTSGGWRSLELWAGERTAGDLMFEAYLCEQGYPEPEHEPALGTTKRPDYLLKRNGQRCMCEVKEFNKDTRSTPDQPDGTVDLKTVLKLIWSQLRQAARQLKEVADLGLPLVVVVTNPHGAWVNLGEREIGVGDVRRSDCRGADRYGTMVRLSVSPSTRWDATANLLAITSTSALWRSSANDNTHQTGSTRWASAISIFPPMSAGSTSRSPMGRGEKPEGTYHQVDVFKTLSASAASLSDVFFDGPQ